MFKKIKLLLLAGVISIGVVGCSSSNNSNTEDKANIVLVLDKGGVQDGSFNESAWNGALMAQEKLGVEVKYLESNTDAEYSQNIETAIDMGSDLIVGIGFNLSEAIENAAKSYPEQQFAIVDGSFEKIPSNVTPITFNEKEAGYLAGLAVGKTVNSDKFGFIGGFEVPAVINYKDGFEEGIKHVNPNAQLYTQYANSFTDASKGRVIAEQMIQQGSKCIMTAAGGVNIGAYEACKEKGKYAVAVDMAQSYMHPDTILTSAIKKVDVGVSETIKKYIDGSLTGGTNLTYSIVNDGVGYEKTNLLSDETINYVNSVIDSIKKDN